MPVGPLNTICFSRQKMRLKKTSTWLFLCYLVLLWNLGPFVHCADSHHHDDFQSAASESPFVLCSCGIPHNDSESESPIQYRALHECSFCDFFDDFQIVFNLFQYESIETPVCTLESIPFLSAKSDIIQVVARGPPHSVLNLFA